MELMQRERNTSTIGDPSFPLPEQRVSSCTLEMQFPDSPAIRLDVGTKDTFGEQPHYPASEREEFSTHIFNPVMAHHVLAVNVTGP